MSSWRLNWTQPSTAKQRVPPVIWAFHWFSIIPLITRPHTEYTRDLRRHTMMSQFPDVGRSFIRCQRIYQAYKCKWSRSCVSFHWEITWPPTRPHFSLGTRLSLCVTSFHKATQGGSRRWGCSLLNGFLNRKLTTVVILKFTQNCY